MFFCKDYQKLNKKIQTLEEDIEKLLCFRAEILCKQGRHERWETYVSDIEGIVMPRCYYCRYHPTELKSQKQDK